MKIKQANSITSVPSTPGFKDVISTIPLGKNPALQQPVLTSHSQLEELNKKYEV